MLASMFCGSDPFLHTGLVCFRRFGSGDAVVMVSSWLPLISLNYRASAFKALDLESWC